MVVSLVGCWAVIIPMKEQLNSLFTFSFLIYILLGSPLYDKNEMVNKNTNTYPTTSENEYQEKEIPMDYHKVESLV